MFILQVTQGPDQGKRLPLEPGRTYTVGCNPDAALVLKDPMVLKDHCSIEAGTDAVILRNHTATAGTFVGDKKIAQARIRGKASITVGDTTLMLTPAPAAEAAGGGGTGAGGGQEKPRVAGRRRPSGPDALVGKILGGYKLKEVVGEGGMGKVYRATQLSLHRDVALKVLRDELAKDKSFRDLFVNEARAAAQLVHPNVVQVYDAGRDANVTFFSMEFIGQGSVEEILARDRKIEWQKAILMVLEAAHGLDYAEGKGIVHRDIKPDNLMINDDGRVKIADLGLAKRGETKDQGIIGTPHFIPPEQALGKEVDTRADIYSLGATFFRMITGKTVFTGKSAKEIVLKHIKEPPPAASSIDKSIPDDLDLVIARMLAKSPEKRYQTAKELISALEEVCAHHGIKGSIIKKGVGKRVLIPLILLLVAAGGAVYYLAARGPKTVKDEDAVRAAAAAEARADQLEKAKQEEARQRRRMEAQNKLLMRENSYNALQAEIPITSVYDDRKQAGEREARWEAVAKEFEEFAETDLAEEFDDELNLATQARQKAAHIRETLRKWKDAAQDKREKIEQQLARAKAIDKELRNRLSELRVNRHYERAALLCQTVAEGKPTKEDPWTEIVEWKWVNPVDASMVSPATEIKGLMKIVDESRKYFRGELEIIVNEAQTVANQVFERVDQLPAEPTEEQYVKLIEELDEIIAAFPATDSGRKNEQIQAIVSAANERRTDLEKRLANLLAEQLRQDRERVADLQRRLASLDVVQLPNSVMDCDFASAISQWNKLLVNEEIKSDLYRRFAKERIQMLRWCEYLFARFHVDLRKDVKGGEEVFLSRDLEVFPIDDEAEITGARLTDEGKDPSEFGISKSIRGDTVFRYARFPVDWIHHVVFLHKNEPRWKDIPPVVRFALGAFCFETMQYKESARHLQKLLEVDDPDVMSRYGQAARSLLARAQREHAARAEWEELCKAVEEAKTSQELAQLKERVLGYGAKHAGTLFHLETLGARTAPSEDFFDASTPLPPEAPPSPHE